MCLQTFIKRIMYISYVVGWTLPSVNSCGEVLRSDDKAEGAADKAFEVAPPAGRSTSRRGRDLILFFAGPAHPPAFWEALFATGSKQQSVISGLE